MTQQGAWQVLRRGLRESPELRRGLVATVALAVATAAGRLVVPVLVQQVLDRGVTGPGGFDARFVYAGCAVAAVVVLLSWAGARTRYRRMVVSSEAALAGLRVRAFEHIHALSVAEQGAQRRGVLTSRVTADIDTLSQFLEWGGLMWIVGPVLMAGCLGLMVAYSWQLSLVAVAALLPVPPVVRALQRGMRAAYDRVRARVADALTEVSESIQGAAVIRAYGLEARAASRLREAVDRQYAAEMRAQRYAATIFPVGELFGAVAISATIAVAAVLGPRWGLTLGDVVAVVVLVTLLLEPLHDLTELFDQTQTALAGWRKVFELLDTPVEIVEPEGGVDLGAGPLPVRLEDVSFAYGDGRRVLERVSVEIPAGSHVAVVGATGSGKSTFARLVCRLADPVGGRVVVGGVDLRDVRPASRRRAIRLVPQDGFLFDTTIADNVRYGLDGAGDAQIRAAFRSLGLDEWVDSLPQGIDTPAGERGESLSVGERQLVALVRAQVAQPGLLILDEATSAVDPETERALSDALIRLSRGRTTISVAHR
ncbi:MAG TPA: ABC transporter ATP-binding protein, partial [Candidatus Dormibacteraeota bacterium]|nr:ABC transporter ATP-binding protein [Candidatus Dormibacteraeota bacterium]